MAHKANSIYTSYLDAPPAACITVAHHPPSHSEGKISGDGGVIGGNGGSAASPRTFLVTGTYTLDTLDHTTERYGTLILHEVVYSDKAASPDDADLKLGITLEICQAVPLSQKSGAILDIRLLPTSKSPTFPAGDTVIVSTSVGYIFVYKIQADITPSLHSVASHKVSDDGTLLLSLAVSTTDPLLISTTTSSSSILLLRFKDTTFKDIEHIAQISNSHDGFEAWTSAFSIDGKTLYSGGDDGTFCAWDISSLPSSSKATDQEDGSDLEPTAIPLLLRNKKAHSYGVTSILPVTVPTHEPAGPKSKEYILTGSYDEHLRIYSPSNSRYLFDSLNLEGGVWRIETLPKVALQPFPAEENSKAKGHIVLLLVSCMHAGAAIVKLQFFEGEGEEGCEMKKIYLMNEHESMNYASCWHRRDIGGNERDMGKYGVEEDEENGKRRQVMVVSTSFYDKRVCIWHL